MQSIKKLPARFYRNIKGNEPVREWLNRLTQSERQVIGKDIQKVEFGWPLGLPVCRPLGEGLWEVRSDLPSQLHRAGALLHRRGSDVLTSWLYQENPEDTKA